MHDRARQSTKTRGVEPCSPRNSAASVTLIGFGECTLARSCGIGRMIAAVQVLRSLHVNEGLATSLAIAHVAFLLSLGYNVGTFLH